MKHRYLLALNELVKTNHNGIARKLMSAKAR